MNIKKFVIYCCYVAVTIVLLAHSFIPHAHHDGKVCFMHAQLHHGCDDSHNTCEHGHDHNHSHDLPDACHMDDFVIRPDINENHENSFSVDASFAYNYVYLLPCLTIIIPETEYHYRAKPYLLHYKSVYAGTIRSLRAPPVYYC